MKVYQVFDKLDPPASDTFCRSRAEAKKVSNEFCDPEIREHEIDTSKAGLIDALTEIPRRVSDDR
jgi:hypothetical protein